MAISQNIIRRYLPVLLFVFLSGIVSAQDDYEIQVYNSETMRKGYTLFELHSNFTPVGNKQYSDKIFPSDKIFHETLEITHGFSDFFEVGFYFFNAIGSDGRTGYAGSHIRPRFSVPESLDLPVGLSLSFEMGYQRIGFFGNHWLFEVHPIIDKELGSFYISVNPTFDWNIDRHDFEFNPCMQVSGKINSKADLGFEWYSGYGPVQNFLAWGEQHQVLFLATNINFGNRWEFNAGVGRGLNPSNDPWIIKCIVGKGFIGRNYTEKKK
jgi:hypothetical protein